MFAPVAARPAICLSMIVRNEGHLVREVLDAVAPYISSWVIVSAGSDDGTRDLIRNHMAALGISGELHERPRRNLGDNRAEALTLAQGHGDYIWVIDADDILVGTPDFTRLGADVYWLRYGNDNGDIFWRARLFRDGLGVRFEGVIREYAAWDDTCIDVRLNGEYRIDSRRRDVHSQGSPAYAGNRDLLLAEVERHPEDPRSVFYLAQSYFDSGDFANARKWYVRRAEMGGWYQEAYYAMYRVAESMANLGAPWLEVQDAYLKAWEFLPTRAEPLHAVAFRCRVDQRYRLGYHYAKLAAEIPFPEEDQLFVREDIYAWRAADEQATCASYIGKPAELFALCRRLLARPDIPDGDRQRIAGNRDIAMPTMLHAASPYPEAVVRGLLAGPGDAEVVASLVAGPDRDSTEQTLNSFLRCCLDVSRVGRFLLVDAGLSLQDRSALLERYGFLEFVHSGPGDGRAAQLAQLRAQVNGRFWLHLGQGWRFFAPENFITRLTAVLKAEPEVFQVGINFADAVKLTGAVAAEQAVRRARDAGRYVLADAAASGPAMFDTARLDRAGGVRSADPDPIAELGQRAAAAGLRTASLDEVFCISGLDLHPQLPWSASVADVINGLLVAGAGRHFAELSLGGSSPYFSAVVAESKVSVPYSSETLARLDEGFLAANPPDGGYDVIFVDTWQEPKHSIDLVERCLAMLSAGGALVVHGSNPPSAWRRQPAEKYEPGSVRDGQVSRAIVEFRIRHPEYDVFTVDAGWGCTVIRPSRRVRQEPAPASVDRLDRAEFERERNTLLNVVNAGWFRRHLYADPYLAGSATLVSHTEVLNVLISLNDLNSYLEIGVGNGKNLAHIIAPIRHSVDPGAALGGTALYQMTSDEFFASGLGVDRYDLIFIDGLHTEDQCRRDLENALARLSDRGWIVAHDVNPPTEWHQRPIEQFQGGEQWNGPVWKALVRFRVAHPEFEVRTLDLDWGCALLRRRAENLPPPPVPELPDTLDWAFFEEHRRELLNLVPPAPEQLPNLLCSAGRAEMPPNLQSSIEA